MTMPKAAPAQNGGGLDGLLGPRSVDAILAERVSVVLGGKRYDMADLSVRRNKEWLASIDGQLVTLLGGLDAAGNDITAIMSVLAAGTDELLGLLISYDANGVLPPREEIEAAATPREILRAVLEVWQAANPLVGIALAGMSQIGGPNSGPTNTSPKRTVGRSGTSRKN